MRFLLALIGCCGTVGMANAQPLPPRVAQAMSYLPPDSETLAVDQKTWPIVVSAKRNLEGEKQDAKREFNLPANLQLGVVTRALAGRTIELSLEARSNFRAPKGFGLMPYDGSGFVYLKPQTGQTRELLKSKLWKGLRQTTLAGQQVAIFEEKREHDVWRIYIAVPRPDTIVTATDRASMITTLARMQRPTLADRAIPGEWSGWKLVDTKAPFWAVRRLDLPQSTGYPVSELRDSTARALVVYHGTGPKEKGKWIVKCDGDQKSLRRLFSSIQLEVPGTILQPKGSGITQFTVKAPDGYFTFYALGLLGTAIFL